MKDRAKKSRRFHPLSLRLRNSGNAIGDSHHCDSQHCLV